MGEIKLHQINLTFQPVEDRLLLRISTKNNQTGALSEIRFWLTRRYVRLLWSVLEKLLEEDIAKFPQVTNINKQAIKSLQQQSDIAQSDFSTPYSPPSSPTESPWGDTSLLLSKIQVKKDANGNSLIYMGSEDGKGIHLNLNTQLINSLMKLLADTAEKAQWDLSLPGIASEMADRQNAGLLM